jgi:L-ribulose-5-phosphate 4-epimerase
MNIQMAIENLVRQGQRLGEEKYSSIGFMALKLDEDAYLLTKSDIDLKLLTETDINGYNMSEGKIGRLFKTRPDISAMFFLRTDCSINVSKKTDLIKPSLDDLAQIIGIDVKVAKNFSDKELMGALGKRNGCYIREEGMLALGHSIEETFAAVRILEKSAYVELMSKGIGSIKHISKFDCSRMNKFYNKIYSNTNSDNDCIKPIYDKKEAEKRKEIVECGIKMVDEGLVQGTWGNISARLDNEYMLVTPSGMDYHSTNIDDIVKVNMDTMDYADQRKPTSEKGIHSAILKMKPNCNAVIHTHPYECSVFAATGKELEVDDIVKSSTLGNIEVIAHAMPGTKKLTKGVVKAMENRNACIMANHGVVCCGEDLKQVLNICRALEIAANKVIKKSNNLE